MAWRTDVFGVNYHGRSAAVPVNLPTSSTRHGGLMGTVQIRVPLRYRHSPLPITQRLQLITVFRLA